MWVKTLDEMCEGATHFRGERKIIVWGSNHFAFRLQKMLWESYQMEIFALVDDEPESDEAVIQKSELLSGHSDDFFLMIAKIISNEILAKVEAYGYREQDFFYMDLDMADIFIGRTGLEVGGPSAFFYRIYEAAEACDGVNFSESTVWNHGNAAKGYCYGGRRLGDFYLTDGVELHDVGEKAYDFLLSSNNLEHIANPMKALLKWREVVKIGGFLLIIVPNKEYSFDHRRDDTSFEHIWEDYLSNVGEDDLSHLDEILEKHDLEIDVRAGGLENFKRRSMKNYQNRCLHHHVFNGETLRKLLEAGNIETVEQGEFRECYYILGKIL